jgi:hypothetical protein
LFVLVSLDFSKPAFDNSIIDEIPVLMIQWHWVLKYKVGKGVYKPTTDEELDDTAAKRLMDLLDGGNSWVGENPWIGQPPVKVGWTVDVEGVKALVKSLLCRP